MKHSSFTWLLAHLIHPFIWAAVSLYVSHELPLEGLPFLVGFTGICLLVSIPALPLCWSINRWVIQMDLKPNEKFILWLFLAPVITFLTAFGFIFIMGSSYVFELFVDMLWIILPAIIATFLSVLIRYPQFIKLLNQRHDK